MKRKYRRKWYNFSLARFAYLHIKLRIINRSASGFATVPPCDVWGRRWTTYLPLWWLTFRFMFLQWQLECKFGMLERIFWSISWPISCLYSTWYFPFLFYLLHKIIIYIRNVELSYSMDVTTTLLHSSLIHLYIWILHLCNEKLPMQRHRLIRSW